MDNLAVNASVRRSCKAIERDTSSFSPALTQLISEQDHWHPFVFGGGRASASPIFYYSEEDLVCEQGDFFGLYLLTETIRGCLSAVNFQIAGTLLLANDLFAPAVASFYTSAFHTLGSYLALNGRVFVNKESLIWISLRESPGVVVGCLTRKGSWVFEKRSRSHSARWKELRHFFGGKRGEIPDYFHRFFRILFSERRKGNPTLADFLENPQGYEAEIEDFLDEFLRSISEIRHRSLYNASGEDPLVRQALVNGECGVTGNLDRHARAFGMFAQSLLNDVSERTCRLIEGVSLNSNRMMALALGVGYPFRDLLKLEFWEDGTELKERIEFIESWIKGESGRGGEACA